MDDKNKFEIILKLIDREDILEQFEQFTREEQDEMWELMKQIMQDEITFVLDLYQDKKVSKNELE
ncbi:hypothetical protein [Cytobacillus horneckiae]|uniref:Uncharacterized protein n=1 Tax=Cytobacillus horneckiae TaxID=549687 RepID=A0A2N0ZB15_9BACI|nr:hypothetical protein [Cytobacillus horneckiae]MEC1158692.1 hypothetical protein [Cytobacillus horneckiae]NRG46650.1 hypothetical protein [Bacillus sp. CRN 9]PKG26696.1 hypothetical protein CWS20_22885 [Cytobacillus horneckiae]